MMSSYQVTVRRRGVSPLTLTMLVAARSRDEAGGIAAALAENAARRDVRGRPREVRRTARGGRPGGRLMSGTT